MRHNSQALFKNYQGKLNDQYVGIMRNELASDPQYTINGLKERIFKRLTDYLDSRASIARHIKKCGEILQISNKTPEKHKEAVLEHTNHLTKKQTLSSIKGFANVLRDKNTAKPNSQAAKSSDTPILESLRQSIPLESTPPQEENVRYSVFEDYRRYYDTSVTLHIKKSGETEINSASIFRHQPLTEQRIELILRLMLDLNLWGQDTISKEQTQNETENLNKLTQINVRLKQAINENDQLNVTSLIVDKNAHFPHFTCIRFENSHAGGGTVFQSQADHALRDCIDMVEKTAEGRKTKTASIKKLSGQESQKPAVKTRESATAPLPQPR